MALLSQVIRTKAITGSTDSVFTCIAGQQGGRWAERTVRAAMPANDPAAAGVAAATAAAHEDPSDKLTELTELRENGVITDDELERLRTRLQA